jgi:hypothetical protein
MAKQIRISHYFGLRAKQNKSTSLQQISSFFEIGPKTRIFKITILKNRTQKTFKKLAFISLEKFRTREISDSRNFGLKKLHQVERLEFPNSYQRFVLGLCRDRKIWRIFTTYWDLKKLIVRKFKVALARKRTQDLVIFVYFAITLPQIIFMRVR